MFDINDIANDGKIAKLIVISGLYYLNKRHMIYICKHNQTFETNMSYLI